MEAHKRSSRLRLKRALRRQLWFDRRLTAWAPPSTGFDLILNAAKLSNQQTDDAIDDCLLEHAHKPFDETRVMSDYNIAGLNDMLSFCARVAEKLRPAIFSYGDDFANKALAAKLEDFRVSVWMNTHA